ncbi:double-stranded RNA-specific editase 1 isoform X1 [Drosophila santomea]|uniref:double-stranded RNA-specific editase 1 isoform X1 n=1 Tax=Drosophila santomea TaxID=129105 RepID=UPI0019540A0A|nr:double-stranded RNA-specific editase 1 isoform X1 [Drosophila santomea]
MESLIASNELMVQQSVVNVEGEETKDALITNPSAKEDEPLVQQSVVNVEGEKSKDALITNPSAKEDGEKTKDALITNPSAKEDAPAVVVPLTDDSNKTSAMDEDNNGPENQTIKDLIVLETVSPEPIDYAVSSSDISTEPEAASDTSVVALGVQGKVGEEDSYLKITEEDSQMDSSENVSMETSNRKKKKSKNKISKRNRFESQLLKVLTPKDALMILKELKGVKIDMMKPKRDHEGQIVAHIVVNSIKYFAKGSSVSSARIAAGEKALQDIFMAKMKAQLAEPEGNSDSDADDLLVKLPSYALHKLLEQWKGKDIDVAALYNEMQTRLQLANEPKTLLSAKELPKSWKNMHPCVVLNRMRPKCIYNLLGSTGEAPNQIFSMGISVDDCEFEANGKSKKSARAKVAALACNNLFGTDFPEL